MGHRRGFSQSIEPNQGALLSGIDEEGALSDPEMGEKADEIAAGLGVDLPIPSAIQSASDGGRESTPLPPPPVEDAQASRKRPEAKRSRRKVTHMTFLQFVNEVCGLFSSRLSCPHLDAYFLFLLTDLFNCIGP